MLSAGNLRRLDSFINSDDDISSKLAATELEQLVSENYQPYAVFLLNKNLNHLQTNNMFKVSFFETALVEFFAKRTRDKLEEANNKARNSEHQKLCQLAEDIVFNVGKSIYMSDDLWRKSVHRNGPVHRILTFVEKNNDILLCTDSDEQGLTNLGGWRSLALVADRALQATFVPQY
jgi:hypothetical protein